MGQSAGNARRVNHRWRHRRAAVTGIDDQPAVFEQRQPNAGTAAAAEQRAELTAVRTPTIERGQRRTNGERELGARSESGMPGDRALDDEAHARCESVVCK